MDVICLITREITYIMVQMESAAMIVLNAGAAFTNPENKIEINIKFDWYTKFWFVRKLNLTTTPFSFHKLIKCGRKAILELLNKV